MASRMVSARLAWLAVVGGLLLGACQPAPPAATPTPPPPKPPAPAPAAPSPAAPSPAVSPVASPVASPAASPSPSPGPAAGTVKVEWLGWSFFRFTSPTGKVILTNPFIEGNPDAAVRLDDITRADLILAPNGHGDEIGNTVQIAQRTGARTLSPFELGTWFMEQGVPGSQVIRSNPGNRFQFEGITVRVVGSVHGSGLPAPTPSTPYGGPAAGFYVTFENGWTVYFTGSSAATQDQALWGSMYKPDAMIFHMGTGTEPRDVAMAIKLTTTDNPNLKTLMPHHHRVTPPAGATTVNEVQAALGALGVNIPITNQVRTQVYEFSK
jgi:L-ascorbate metabolism protein UlaG (beta-lactamase superfamily)